MIRLINEMNDVYGAQLTLIYCWD